MKPTEKRHGHDKLSVITLAGVIVWGTERSV